MNRYRPYKAAFISAVAGFASALLSFAFLYWVADSIVFSLADGFLFTISQWATAKLLVGDDVEHVATTLKSKVLAVTWWPLCIVAGLVGVGISSASHGPFATFLAYAFPAATGVFIGGAILHPGLHLLRSVAVWLALISNLVTLAIFVWLVNRFDYGGSIQTKHYGAFIQFAYLLPLAPIDGWFFGYAYASTRQQPTSS